MTLEDKPKSSAASRILDKDKIVASYHIGRPHRDFGEMVRNLGDGLFNVSVHFIFAAILSETKVYL